MSDFCYCEWWESNAQLKSQSPIAVFLFSYRFDPVLGDWDSYMETLQTWLPNAETSLKELWSKCKSCFNKSKQWKQRGKQEHVEKTTSSKLTPTKNKENTRAIYTQIIHTVSIQW